MGGRIVSPELIGRETELQTVARALDEAAAGRGRTILIGGEAGIGKSRMLAAALDAARAGGAIVLQGGCVNLAEGALPFAAIVEAIRPLLRQETGAEAARNDRLDDPLIGVAAGLGLVSRPTSAEAAAELRPEWARSQLYESFLGLLRRLSAEAPVVLAIEDVHWAGDSTRELLAFLARNTRAERLLLLITFRSDELHRRHPLLFWLGEADRLPGVERLEMPRLDREAVRRQLAAILGRTPDAGIVESIYARSEGNPFFAEELLATDVEDATLPPTLREVLAARLAHVSEPTLRLLGVAALVGRSVDHDLLARTSELSEDDLEASLDEAISAQLLVAENERRTERYTFRHALVAEAVADTVLPGRRRRLHATIAAALTDSNGYRGAEEAGHLVEVAHHWFEARELAPAFESALRAGDATQAASAYSEALTQYERALELWDVVGVSATASDVDRIELLRRTARAAQLAGEGGRAAQLLREAVELARDCGDRVLEGLLSERLGRALWTSADFDGAERAYRRAIELVPDEPPTADRARVLAGHAQVLMLAGHHQESLANGHRALELARLTRSRQIEGHALCTIGSDLGLSGGEEKGAELIREALAIAEEVQDFDDIGRAYACLSSILEAGGRVEEGLEVALRGAERMRELGMSATYGAFNLMNAADLMITLGRWDEADRIVRERRPIARGTSRVLATQQVATLAIGRGDWATADEALEGLASAVGRSVEAQFNGPMAVSRVNRATLTHRFGDGRAAMDRVGSLLAQTEDADHEARLLAASLRLEAEAAEVARAARDASGLELALVRGRAQLVAIRALPAKASEGPRRVAVLRSVSSAEAEATRLEGTSDVAAWRAALTRLVDGGPVYEAAYSRYRLAEALLTDRKSRSEAETMLAAAFRDATALGARPLRTSIEALAARARISLSADGAASTESSGAAAATADAGAAGQVAALGAYGLSDRELEVLRLLATGKTNRQIGETLFISESTAGVHVSHILTKLGVAGRVEAAAIAARLDVQA